MQRSNVIESMAGASRAAARAIGTEARIDRKQVSPWRDARAPAARHRPVAWTLGASAAGLT
jgi:hypothetical protein